MNQASTKLVARTTEGATETRAIGSALRTIADVYDEEERNNVHEMNKLY